MKITYQLKNGITIEADGKNQRDIFDQLSSLQSVFGISNCGKCNSDDIKFVTKKVDKFTFREAHCNKCYAKLSFGTHQDADQTLFPKIAKDDKFLPDKGWLKFNKETGKSE